MLVQYGGTYGDGLYTTIEHASYKTMDVQRAKKLLAP